MESEIFFIQKIEEVLDIWKSYNDEMQDTLENTDDEELIDKKKIQPVRLIIWNVATAPQMILQFVLQ